MVRRSRWRSTKDNLAWALDRASVAFCWLLGSTAALFLSLCTGLGVITVALLTLGGALYSAGIPFYLLARLRFHNAIWHLFVLLAAACHYFAILTCVTL